MSSVTDRIILFPRFTTLFGEETFDTQGMNVAAYESGDIAVWLGPVLPPGVVTATFQESTDQSVWTTCSGTSVTILTPQSEQLFSPSFSKAWMRLRVVLSTSRGDSPTATLWAVGTLDKRRR